MGAGTWDLEDCAAPLSSVVVLGARSDCFLPSPFLELRFLDPSPLGIFVSLYLTGSS